MGQGAAAARRDRRAARRRRSHDARRTRRARPRRRPGRHPGAARRRRRRAARTRGLRDVARRTAACRSGSARISTGSRARPQRLRLPPPPRGELAAIAKRGDRRRCRRPMRRCDCSGPPGARTAARRRASCSSRRSPPDLDELRARGLRLAVVALGARRARGCEVDELRREHGGPGRSRPARAPTTRSSSRRTTPCSRRRPRTSGSAKATGC